jgi:hypothetical protein
MHKEENYLIYVNLSQIFLRYNVNNHGMTNKAFLEYLNMHITSNNITDKIEHILTEVSHSLSDIFGFTTEQAFYYVVLYLTKGKYTHYIKIGELFNIIEENNF